MTLTPLYTEDLLYAAYLDRLLVKSLALRAGIISENESRPSEYLITAGSGLQVLVCQSRCFVAETGAIEGSGVDNGLYHVQIPTEQNPSNSVEVSSSNPQIARIVLRVYDIGELKIGGSSYAKIEWVNGTPTSEATEAKMKAGEFPGAAALPASSLNLAYVLVPKNATKSSEFYIQNRAPSLKQARFNVPSSRTVESTSFVEASVPDEVVVNTGSASKFYTAVNIAFRVVVTSSVSNAGAVGLFCNGQQMRSIGNEACERTANGTTPNLMVMGETGNINRLSENYTGGEGSTYAISPAMTFNMATNPGTKRITLRYKASSGKVTITEASLYAWVAGG